MLFCETSNTFFLSIYFSLVMTIVSEEMEIDKQSSRKFVIKTYIVCSIIMKKTTAAESKHIKIYLF